MSAPALIQIITIIPFKIKVMEKPDIVCSRTSEFLIYNKKF